jgi:hypothetical protein
MAIQGMGTSWVDAYAGFTDYHSYWTLIHPINLPNYPTVMHTIELSVLWEGDPYWVAQAQFDNYGTKDEALVWLPYDFFDGGPTSLWVPNAWYVTIHMLVRNCSARWNVNRFYF